jgi:hypothetical protein
MLEALITSRTRIKLMLKFFLNSDSTAYLRSLEPEFGESTNAIRQELNRFEAAGLLTTDNEKNRKIYRANLTHPLFNDINSLVRKYVGMDEIIDKVINHLGEPYEVYLTGDLASGTDSRELRLIIVGDHIDHDYLETLTQKAQKLVSRNIQYIVFTKEEFIQQKPFLDKEKLLLVWKNLDKEL